MRTALPRRQSTRYPGVYWRQTKRGRSYEISYVDSLGNRQFKTVPGNEKDARQALHQIQERMLRGAQWAPSKKKVSELADLYIDTATSHMKQSTRTQYQESINAHVKPKLGHIKVCDLTVNHVAELVAGMRDTHAAYTIANTLKPLSGMYRLAVRRGWAAANPVTQLERDERPKGYQAPMRILTSEEIAAVLRNSEKWMEGHYRLLLETAIFTGLRVGELCNLRWEDIDWEAGELKVTESKTRAGLRDVAVPDFLLQRLAGSKETSALVFVQENGRPINDVIARRALAKSLEGPVDDEGNYPDKITSDRIRFHDLRHTYASLLISQGCDVVMVSKLMGHANPAITLRVYAKVFDLHKRRAEVSAKINEAFQGVVV